MLSLGLGLHPQVAVSGVSYDADATAYFARMTTQPDATQKGYISTLIAGIKSDNSLTNLSDGFDCFYIFAGHDGTEALLNAAKASHDCTAVNSPTFTASQGFTGNGTTQYINTNYNPSTEGVRFTSGSGSLGVYLRLNVNESLSQIGARDGSGNRSHLNSRHGDIFYGYCQSSADTGPNAANTDSRGLFTAVRTSGTNINSYKNGVLHDSETNSTGTIPSYNFYILTLNANGSPGSLSTNQVAIAFVSNNNINQASLYTRIQDYMTSLGTQV